MKRFLPIAFFPIISLITSCSNDHELRKIIEASNMEHRPCDLLGLKVLKVSYENAAQNQGRLVAFLSTTNIPIKYKDRKLFRPEYLEQWMGQHLLNKNGFVFNKLYGELEYKGIVYYIDSNGIPRLAIGGETNKADIPRAGILGTSPDEKFVTAISQFGLKDNRIESKTADSVTCSITFIGEGNVSTGDYLVSEDSKNLYWRRK